jgi:hypothetical protein
MKKISLMAMAAGMLVLVACNGGDDPKPNEIVIDGESLELIDGFTDELGTICWGGGARQDEVCVTHTYTVAMITDGQFAEMECWPEGYMALVEMGLYSPGQEGLTAGTYSIYSNEPGPDQTGNSFGWFYLEWYVGELYYYSQNATGTVTITGTHPNLTFKFDIDFSPYGPTREEGVTTVSLSGQYKGTFADQSLCD